MSNINLPQRGWIRKHLLLKSGVLPFQRVKLDEEIKAGRFPAPRAWSPRVVAFDCEQVHRWINAHREAGGQS